MAPSGGAGAYCYRAGSASYPWYLVNRLSNRLSERSGPHTGTVVRGRAVIVVMSIGYHRVRGVKFPDTL